MRRRGLRRVPPKRWRASWCSFASLLESRPAVGYRSAARDHSTHDGAAEYLLARERLVKKLGRVRPSSKPATEFAALPCVEPAQPHRPKDPRRGAFTGCLPDLESPMQH